MAVVTEGGLFNPLGLCQTKTLYRMNYTSFLIFLIEIILKENDDMTIDDIGLSEHELRPLWAMGVTPEFVYYSIWEDDAGNYLRCPV